MCLKKTPPWMVCGEVSKNFWSPIFYEVLTFPNATTTTVEKPNSEAAILILVEILEIKMSKS